MELALTTRLDVEQDAVRRCQAGDIDALGVLYQLHRDAVLQTAYGIIGQLQPAEDVTQRLFIELFASIKRYDVRRPFLPWLHCIAVRRSLDELRRSRNGETVPLELAPDLLSPFTSPEEAAEASELRVAVWSALGSLKERERAALVLKYYQGFSEAEMAVALACSGGRVKSLLHEAREHLREVLAAPTSGGGLPQRRPRHVSTNNKDRERT